MVSVPGHERLLTCKVLSVSWYNFMEGLIEEIASKLRLNKLLLIWKRRTILYLICVNSKVSKFK